MYTLFKINDLTREVRNLNFGMFIHINSNFREDLVCVFILASNAIVVISASGVAAILISQGKNNTLSITGHLKPGLPDFKPPDFSYTKDNITITASTIFSVSSTYVKNIYRFMFKVFNGLGSVAN